MNETLNNEIPEVQEARPSIKVRGSSRWNRLLLGLGMALAVATGCATPTVEQTPIITPGRVISEKAREYAEDIRSLNEKLAEEVLNPSLNKYSQSFMLPDLEFVSGVLERGAPFTVTSDAVIGSSRNQSMVLKISRGNDRDNDFIHWAEVSMLPPLMGDPLPEFTTLGVNSDRMPLIPERNLKQVALTAFNLPEDIRWGEVRYVDPGGIKEASELTGSFRRSSDNTFTEVTASTRGPIRYKINPNRQALYPASSRGS